MLKSFKSFFTIFLIGGILLTSCQDLGATSNTTSNTGELSSNSPTSIEDSSTSSTTQNSSYLWSEEIDALLYEVLNESYKSLPVFECSDYEGSKRVEDNINVADIKAYTDDSNCSLTYSIVLRSNGFALQNQEYNGRNYYLASLQLSIYQTLCVSYVYVDDVELPYLSLSTYIVDTLLETWPSEDLINLFGFDIPSLDAESYQFNHIVQNNIDIAQIYCFGLENLNEATIQYKTILENDGYVVYTNQDIYYAHKDQDNIEVDFYCDLENQCIYIQAYLMQGSKNWPVDDLEIFYPFEIPQYYEEGVRYDYGMFQNESSFIYYIDCYYVSPTSEEKYKKILEENSFTYLNQYPYEEYGYIFTKSVGQETCNMQFYFDYTYMVLSIYFILN